MQIDWCKINIRETKSQGFISLERGEQGQGGLWQVIGWHGLKGSSQHLNWPYIFSIIAPTRDGNG
jgi:hypothetical protein